MENVILIVLLILALVLIGLVLIQRSEGGGLGMGGGGGAVSGRAAGTALSKLTWIFGAAFMAMCIAMTILGAQNTRDTSVVDTLGTELPAADGGDASPLGLPAGEGLLPPTGEDGGLTPPRAD